MAANIAQAASTALPPLSKIFAPAVAAKGFPVMAIQFLPCKGGFCVGCANKEMDITINNKLRVFFIFVFFKAFKNTYLFSTLHKKPHFDTSSRASL